MTDGSPSIHRDSGRVRHTGFKAVSTGQGTQSINIHVSLPAVMLDLIQCP